MATINRSDYWIRYFDSDGMTTVYLEDRSTSRTWGFQLNLDAPNSSFNPISPVERPEVTAPKRLKDEDISWKWQADTLVFGIKLPDGWRVGLKINLADPEPTPAPTRWTAASIQKPQISNPLPPPATKEDELIPLDDDALPEAGASNPDADFKFT